MKSASRAHSVSQNGSNKLACQSLADAHNAVFRPQGYFMDDLNVSQLVRRRPYDQRTCAANRKLLRASQSRSSSCSSSFRRSSLRTSARAAVTCSDNMRSTVAANGATDLMSGTDEMGVKSGEPDRTPLTRCGVPGGDVEVMDSECWRLQG